VIAFSAIAALASAVVLGLIGGLQAIKPDIAPALKEDSTGSIGGRTTGGSARRSPRCRLPSHCSC
jgi:hypothetical protein